MRCEYLSGLAVSDSTISWSTDGGVNWDEHTSADYTMGISAVNSQEAWAVRDGWNGTIYHTADGGTNWMALDKLNGKDLPGLGTVSFSIHPVPEPSILALLGLGGLFLMCFRGQGFRFRNQQTFSS